MLLTHVAVGDPHTAAHNAERDASNTHSLRRNPAKRMMNALHVANRNVSWMNIGDSTGSRSTGLHKQQWVYQTARALASMFPQYTVRYHCFDPPNGVYDSGSPTFGSMATIQVGTGTANGGGPYTFDVWNYSIAGQTTESQLGQYWATCGPGAKSPLDWITINHGHNEGYAGSNIGVQLAPLYQSGASWNWFARMAALTESCGAAAPEAQIAIMIQNPQSSVSTQGPAGTQIVCQQQRADAYRNLADMRGYGTIDVQQPFLDLGTDYPNWLNTDGVHPLEYTDALGNAPAKCGQQLITQTVMDALTVYDTSESRPQPGSAHNQHGEGLLLNNDFSTWTDTTTVPDNWTLAGTSLSSAVVTQDTSAGNNESANGYSLKITQTTSYLYLKQSLPLSKVLGRRVTVTAPVKWDPSSDSNIARLDIVETGGDGSFLGYPHGDTGNTGGRFHHISASKVINPAATAVEVRLFVNPTYTGGPQTINVDRIDAVLGMLPYRQPSSKPGARGLAGPSGTPGVDLFDYWSTFGNGRPAAAASVGLNANIALVANQRVDTPILCPRAGTINGIRWVPGFVGAGNYDIAIMKADGTILWSKGITALSARTVNTVNTETVSPGVAVTLGQKIYICVVSDTASFLMRGFNAAFLGMTIAADATSFFQVKKASAGPPITAGLGSGDISSLPFFVLNVT